MLNFINNCVWGMPLLVMLIGTGLLCSLRLGFFQLRCFPFIMKRTFFSLFRKEVGGSSGKGGISQFQAVSASLAAAMGTGNIVGVAAAIAVGGAGAIFWMWVSAILGMALVYSENYLGAVYRRQVNGRWYGGPMAYLEYGAGKKWLGAAFAVCCGLAALGMGNMTQVNSVSQAMNGSFGVPCKVSGVILAVICGAIVSGGIKRIGSVTQVLIPVLTVGYMGAAVFIILRNGGNIPSAFSRIFTEAFGVRQAGGGISGAVISRAVSTGLRRGVFSNEAGLGSSAVLHSPAEGGSPQQLGMWAVFEVFADTIVCCTLTALVILTTGAENCGGEGVMMVTAAFSKGMGKGAEYFIACAVVLFAFATVIGWFYCGECAVTGLFGEEGIAFYRVIFIAFVYIGAVSELEAVWTVSDIFNGMMAIPNLTGLIILRKEVKFES